jgi:2-aminoadipate transaminase
VPSQPHIGAQQPQDSQQSRGSRVDRYVDHYAARAKGMVASEIRALFAVAARPEIVSLAGGMPFIAALPLDAVGEMAGQLVADRGTVALQYGTGQGDPGLREEICEVMSLEGIRAHPDEVVVTVGSQQGLDLITRIFVDPGDVVLAEGPSYVGALGTFASYQADVVHIPMDDHGLVPEALDEAITRLAAEGRRVKFLYTVPSFHNPAGVTLGAARRARVLSICQRAGFPIIEDNPYGLLGFDGEPQRALRADDAQGVVYLGTFSKTIAPGLRVGWVAAPPGIRDRLVLAAESAVLCHSSLAQLMVREYLATQPWREQVKVFRELYRERRDAMLESLAALMPAGCRWTRPAGGFYVWLQLPPGVNSKAMLPRAISSRVAYVPGTGFYADGSGAGHLRLSYCFPEPDRIREGVRRLAEVVGAEVDLLSTFGVAPPPGGAR